MSSSIVRVQQALLVLSLTRLADAFLHAETVSQATGATDTRLLVVVIAPDVADIIAAPTAHWHIVQDVLQFLYRAATAIAARMDKPLMTIDVVLHTPASAPAALAANCADCAMVFRADGDDAVLGLPDVPVTRLAAADPAAAHPPHTSPPLASDGAPHGPSYAVAALGGTFDHLHAGHRILLSLAALVATRKLIVGVTDDALLVRKKNRAVLEPLATRIARVRAFLVLFRPDITHDVVPISDVYGPTAWDADIQALVVSAETLPGAASIAKLRSEKGFPALEVLVIDVVSSDGSHDANQNPEEAIKLKMSSTTIRQWIVDHASSTNAATSK